MIYSCLCNFTNIVGFNGDGVIYIDCRAELKNISVIRIQRAQSASLYPRVVPRGQLPPASSLPAPLQSVRQKSKTRV